jgi:hypothetical protein
VDSQGLEELLGTMLHFDPAHRRPCHKLLQEHRFFATHVQKHGRAPEHVLEWVSKSYPFADRCLMQFAEKCGGEPI